MPTNDFVPFATGGGANVESQAAYLADPALSTGQQPGIASSALNNKSLRQANFVASQLAQLASNLTGTDTVDNGVTAQFLSQLKASLQAFPPVINNYTSTGSTTYGLPYLFFIATGSATVGATYTNNAITYTVLSTIASGTVLSAQGAGTPTTTGTLTKSGGSGDATLTFYAYRAPIYLRVRAVGASGGGAGSGTAGSTDGAAGTTNTDFQIPASTVLVSCAPGSGGGGVSSNMGGLGGAATVTSPAVKVSAFSGGAGGSTTLTNTANSQVNGGMGGVSFFGGAGRGGGSGTTTGGAPVSNSGSGGGGAGSNANANTYGGAGGGAGGFAEAIISTPAATYTVIIGTKGAAGAAGTNGVVGAVGSDGYVEVTAHFQ